jgi:hypothetical protein
MRISQRATIEYSHSLIRCHTGEVRGRAVWLAKWRGMRLQFFAAGVLAPRIAAIRSFNLWIESITVAFTTAYGRRSWLPSWAAISKPTASGMFNSRRVALIWRLAFFAIGSIFRRTQPATLCSMLSAYGRRCSGFLISCCGSALFPRTELSASQRHANLRPSKQERIQHQLMERSESEHNKRMRFVCFVPH